LNMAKVETKREMGWGRGQLEGSVEDEKMGPIELWSRDRL